MIEIDKPDTQMLKVWNKENWGNCPGPTEQVGHLFKAAGWNGVRGRATMEYALYFV
jgi:hypothetical protein